MTPNELISQVVIGSVVQVIWVSALFDPDAVIKPGTKSAGLSKIFSCGFVADIGANKEYITIGIDAMYEAGNKDPSFRTTLTIPVVNIVSAEIYGKLS